MTLSRRNQLALGAVVLFGLLAILQQSLSTRRPLSAWLRANQDFVVTSAADRGPGSLREAIFAADSAKQRARILLRSNRIVLESPLPPLVNPDGVIVEVDSGTAEIDASHIGFGPVFDIDAPNSDINGVAVSNAPDQAVLVRKSGFRLSNASLVACDVGLYASEGASDLVAENSRFEMNRIGIELSAYNSGTILRNNQFRGHENAAIWAVRGSQREIPQSSEVELKGNHFDGDRLSVVLGNFPALVEANEFVKAREAALYLTGRGATVRGNRIRNGAGIGVFAHTSQETVIESNEVDHNHALAVLVRSSSNDVVQKNRLYDNGYGIAFVLGDRQRPNIAADNTLLSQQFDGIILIGDSPVIRGNRLLSNNLAGLRILDFVSLTGNRVVSEPFLGDNALAGNKLNEPIRGEYRVTNSK